MPKQNYFRFSGAILNFGVKESPVKVGMGTVEKLTLETWETFKILSLAGTGPEIHMGVFYSPNCNARLKLTTLWLKTRHRLI